MTRSLLPRRPVPRLVLAVLLALGAVAPARGSEPGPEPAGSWPLLPALGAAAPASGSEPGPEPGLEPAGSWPLRPPPAVVRGFQPPASAYGSGHRGVDLAGRAGQPVRAALPGRITFAGQLAGRGVVVVDHGTTRTTYEPVEAGVEVGDQVFAGDRIGRLATTGSHCPPAACLHWGWVEGDTYLDPLRLVGGGSVRLLPLSGSIAQSPPRGPRGSSLLERVSADAPLLKAPTVLVAGARSGPWTWPRTGHARGCACW